MMYDASISVFQNIFYLEDSVYTRKIKYLLISHKSKFLNGLFLGKKKKKGEKMRKKWYRKNREAAYYVLSCSRCDSKLHLASDIITDVKLLALILLCTTFLPNNRPLVKSAYQIFIFLISQLEGSFEYPKHMLKTLLRKYLLCFAENFCLSKPVIIYVTFKKALE